LKQIFLGITKLGGNAPGGYRPASR